MTEQPNMTSEKRTVYVDGMGLTVTLVPSSSPEGRLTAAVELEAMFRTSFPAGTIDEAASHDALRRSAQRFYNPEGLVNGILTFAQNGAKAFDGQPGQPLMFRNEYTHQI